MRVSAFDSRPDNHGNRYAYPVTYSELNPANIDTYSIYHNLDTDAINRLTTVILFQIEQKSYNSEMTEIGITNILKLGVTFSRKKIQSKT